MRSKSRPEYPLHHGLCDLSAAERRLESNAPWPNPASSPKPPRKPVKKAARRKRAQSRAKVRAKLRPRLRGKAGTVSGRKGKWVYAFGGGKAEGRAAMRNLLGGKGAGLAEMAHLGLPVPPGFTITTEVCTYFYDARQNLSEGSEGAGRGGAGRSRPHHRQEIRRREKSAAGLGALRRPRLDAGHDGHRAQSRAQRHDGRGAWRKNPATGALRLTATGASSPCIPTWCSASNTNFEEILDEHKEQNGYTLDTDLERRRSGRRSSSATRSASSRNSASRSRRIRTRNCGAPSARCSARG